MYETNEGQANAFLALLVVLAMGAGLVATIVHFADQIDGPLVTVSK